ncbi:MAG TPA: AAA family ATPase, partial [Kofleriaceae bacterium]
MALRDANAAKVRAAGAVPNAITRGHAELLLQELAVPLDRRTFSTGPAAMSDEDLAEEAALRDQTASSLPLDELAAALELDPFEVEAIALCAACELDPDYERIFAYVHDDVSRRVPSIELASGLTASSTSERVARRTVLGPFGKLRRTGVLVATLRDGGLRDELRLSPAACDAVFGVPTDFARVFCDPAEVRIEAPVVAPADEALVTRAARALAEGRIDIAAVWGPTRTTRTVVASLAAQVERPLRRFTTGSIQTALSAARALDTLLWIDGDALTDELASACRATCVPLVLTGEQPWRPSELLAERRLIEIPIVAPHRRDRLAIWRAELPELSTDRSEQAATNFRFDAIEVRAVARTARTTASLMSNGHAARVDDVLEDACRTVARKHGERHTTLVNPRRGREDLVLPSDLHARVMDLVRYFRSLPRVMEDWGFASRVSGAGLKALFTGEPGTGKTLAAEVIAKELGLPMLRVDLARVVSKWIGETEKNLDLVFGEARDSHAVLFFDEAEALFGARGDVRHGTDRYANLEVSYLLQRFEDHGGVVVLATNLRDKIDAAFMRRFHVVVGFPRPTERERRRMWQRVFTP